jgi:hypothetical protein
MKPSAFCQNAKKPRINRGFLLERVTGIEPAQPAWKAGTLTIELHPRV